ncbi:hypothetical protein ACVXG9_24805 [Escherichia coli]
MRVKPEKPSVTPLPKCAKRSIFSTIMPGQVRDDFATKPTVH